MSKTQKIIFCFFAMSLCTGCLPTASTTTVNAGSFHRGIFSIRINLNGPIDVGVVKPSGEFFFLVGGGFECPGTAYADHRLTIDTNRAAGISSGEKPEVSLVFDRAGEYKILVSDNLETELNNSYSTTFRLEFVPKPAITKQKPFLPTCVPRED